jgi:riboflavin synthase
MFSGIIRSTAVVKSLSSSGVLTVSGVPVCQEGDSVAVNGVCLTVVSFSELETKFDVSSETLRRTNLGGLASGEIVNLEFPLSLSSLIHGHLVQGHVDGVGTVAGIIEEGDTKCITIGYPTSLAKYLVTKGSVTVNGVSLTVGEIQCVGEFPVYIISKTWEWTNFQHLKVGDSVNLEVDIVAKYVESLLEPSRGGRSHSPKQ